MPGKKVPHAVMTVQQLHQWGIMEVSSGDIIMLRLHAIYLYSMHCMHSKKLKGKNLPWTINQLINTSKVGYNHYGLFKHRNAGN